MTDVLLGERDQALAAAAERAAKTASGVLIGTDQLHGRAGQAFTLPGEQANAADSVRHAVLNHAHGPVVIVPSA